MVSFDIKPGRRILAIEGNVEEGCLQHFNPGLVVDWRAEVPKEGQV